MNIWNGQGAHVAVGRRAFSIGLGLFAVVLVLGMPVRAQPAAFQKAKDAYEFAEYEKAIDLFSQVAQDTSQDKSIRKDALRYLGRAYVAKDKRNKAREAIRTLLKLEPPIVELDPDREPPPIMDLYYEVRKQMEGYAVQKRDPGMKTLAIMDFTNGSVDEKERYNSLQKGFPDMMIHYLNGGTDLKVVEREHIQWLLKELKLQRKPGVVDQSTAVRAGKLLGAHAVIFGSYIIHDDQMWLSARMVKVETGEIMLTEKLFGDPDEFFDLIEDLSMRVTRAINVELEETKLGMDNETRSLDAKIAFSDGLEELEDGNYRAAYEKFLEALEYDSDYTRAKVKAESLKPMLAASGTGGAPDNMNR